MDWLLLLLLIVSIALGVLNLSKKKDSSEVQKSVDELKIRFEELKGAQVSGDKAFVEQLSENRKELNSSINDFKAGLTADFTSLKSQNESLTKAVETKLGEIRTDNEKRLEQMRQTVEEKLQKTLESRLSTSFKQVGDQLEKVYTQLGEMQNLSKGIGTLEKVLTNVKTRGVWGELQAERILQEMLTPDQYLRNVATKKGSRDVVEFAVKLPGREQEEPVLLPIDSKFPREDYERLCNSLESGDTETAVIMRKALERRITDEAKTISEKYIDVPNTTDFAVLFLPIEGLYAEILSVPGLSERIQNQFHVMIAGPTTLASLLNSLQMGFRTLAIEKKSSEVWRILGEVKTEFGRFGSVLEAVKKKLGSATEEIDRVFVRQRAIDRKLRTVESVEEQKVLEADDANDW